LGGSGNKLRSRKTGTKKCRINILRSRNLERLIFLNILVFRPFQFQKEEKTNSGYKHNSKVSRGICIFTSSNHRLESAGLNALEELLLMRALF